MKLIDYPLVGRCVAALCFAFVATVDAWHNASAAVEADGKKYVVFIGVNDYNDSRALNLNYCASDVEALV